MNQPLSIIALVARSLRSIGKSGAAILVVLCGMTGCETTNSDRFEISVEDNLDRAPAFAKEMKYIFVYDSRESEALVEPFDEELGAALSRLGYEEGTPSDADLLIYVMMTMDELLTRTHRVNTRRMIGATNPDSIRYKNLANGPGTQLGTSLEGGSDEVSLLNDDPNDPGGVIIGPGGELIETGSERQKRIDDSVSTVDIEYRVSRLEVAALEVPVPDDPNDYEFPWRVRAVSDARSDKPSPSVQDLVDAVAARLLDRHPEKPVSSQ